MKAKKFKIAIIVLLLVSGAIAFLQRHPSARRKVEPPFKFSRPSSGESNAYPLFDPTGIRDFTSNIPVIVLRNESGNAVSMSKQFSDFAMGIYEPELNGIVSLTNPPAITIKVGLHVRGMVSRLFPKLSYRLKLPRRDGAGDERALLGMPAHEDWVLHGPWLDKSLIRNAFSYDLARAMGVMAMRTRPCELFLSTSGRAVTEADYLGVYQLTEHIERGSDRVKVKKLLPDSNTEPEVTGGYLLAWEVGPGNYLPSWKPAHHQASLQLLYPKHPSDPQTAWIDRAFKRFDAALKTENFRDPEAGYAAHVEIDDWVNYFVFQELIFNLDAWVRSFYLCKERGGKIRPGAVWDHDLALGNQFPQGTTFTNWWYIPRNPPNGWITRMMGDPAFREKVVERWARLRPGVLSDAQLDARVDSIAAPLLAGAADRNFDRWKVLNVERPFHEGYVTFATKTYPEQLDALKKFLHERAAWIDDVGMKTLSK